MSGRRALARRHPNRLFKEHAAHLQAAVRASVHTTPVNVEDACAFAGLQLIRRQPAHRVRLALHHRDLRGSET